MRVSLLNKTLNQLPGITPRFLYLALSVVVLSGLKLNPLWAEGSKNFISYPGYRMFLDTRDSQQLKVFARVGEYINVGASHVGVQNGFIKVYRPDGTLAVTFDDTGSSTGLAKINNSVQEINGPTGGGTTLGQGYVPGVIQVQPGQEGIWTVIFDYPSYVNSGFTNLLNNAPWTSINQPNSRRVVLAWDVTVTIGAAGNNGGTPRNGRLYSNEHISLINGNGFSTSPTFYVLTQDGFLYEVKINQADPFRFPISSNSLGLVDGNGNPVYKSKPESAFTRSADPNSWLPNQLYLYEPQAEDSGPLINNKIFFSLPDTTMPETALVTDIIRNNTHTTWLFKQLQLLELTNFFFQGANTGGPPCAPGSISFGKGGWFYFETNLGGSATLQLDLNNNGVFNDPQDVTLMGTLNEGLDSIFWNGANGLGIQIPLQDSFAINYTGVIRFGELHIALTDVENNNGGVTFKWLNAPPNTPDSLFYYDHTDVGGPISFPFGGTPIPGVPQPTTTPYIYSNNAGNDRYLDQWFFKEFDIDSNTIYVNIVIDCVCENATPVLSAVSDPGAVCAGQSLVLSAANTVPGIGNLTYNWSGPNSFTFSQTVGALETSTATIDPATAANQGAYSVIASTAAGCADTLNFNAVVNPLPVASAITGGGAFCEGQDVTLSSMNTISGIAQVSYQWTGPNNFTQNGTAVGTTPITLTIPSLSAANAGTYTLTLTSNSGCVGQPVSTTVSVNPTPVLQAVSGSGNYCQNANVTLTASNTAPGINTMICVWTGPNNFTTTQTVGGGSPIILNFTNVNNSFEGTYTVICSNSGCPSAPVSFNLNVDNTPEINGISPNGSFCAGTSITLTAQNVVAGTGPITYTWTGPNPGNPLFPFTATVNQELGPFPVTIPSLTAADAGTYCLVLSTAGGCLSTQQCVNIGIAAAPTIINVQGAGDACTGQNVTLSAQNSTPGLAPIIFTWSGPNGIIIAGVGNDTGPYTATINNIGPNDAGLYTLSLVSNVTNCVSDTSFTINVFPGLNIENVSPDSSYCSGSTVVLSATNTVAAGNLTYQWTGPTGQVFGPFTVGSFDPLTVTIPNITLNQAGAYTLTVTSSSGCVGDPVTVNVGVRPNVDITSVSGGGQYCVGENVVLNGTGQGAANSVIYTWTNQNGVIVGSGNTTAAGPFPATVTNPIAGTYTLVVETNLGCSDTATVEVEFIQQPVAFVLNNDTTLCDLDTLTICGQNLTPGVGTFTYVWATPNGEIIAGSASGNEVFCDEILPLVTFGAGPYSLIINANGCISDPDTFYLDLNPNPVISQITGGGTYCEGEPVDLCFWNTNPAVDSFFYTCILPGGIQTTGVAASGDTICLTLTVPGFVCCSLESFDGCVSSLACAEIIYEPGPDIVATAVPSSVCADETLGLTGVNNAPGSGTVTYTWLNPDGSTLFTGTAPWAGPFPATDPTPQSGDYCLIVSNGGNCSDTACVTVIVNPVPEVVGNTITGGGTFCEGETTILSATISIADGSIISYTWTLSGNPVLSGTAPSGSTVTLDLGALALNESGQYCLELVSNQGCTANPVCTTVTVNPTPKILTVTGGGTYCEGVTVPLNGTGQPGLGTVTYTWTGPGGVIFTGTAPSQGPFPATIPNITPAQAGVYTLVLSLGGCDSEPASVVVVVNPMPKITNVSGGGTFCSGQSTTISFTVDPNGAQSVNWAISGPGLNESGTVTQLTTLTFNVVANSASAGTYTITASSNAGCEATPQSVVITVQNITPPVLTASPSALCQGDELQLSTTPQQGSVVTYEWFKDGVSLGTTSTPLFDIFNPMAGSYTVTVNVDGCTATSAAVVVTLLPPPVANDDNYTTTVGGPFSNNVLTNDQTNGNVTITIVSGPASGTVQLTGGGGFTYTPNGTVKIDSFEYEICQVTCPDVCDRAKVIIQYELECIVPNIITPNGDGVNDALELTCTPPTTSRMRIFNRWGDEISVFEPYVNENAWDGTYGGDKKPVPAGTYYYLFEPDKNSSEGRQAGYVKVVR